MTPVRYLILSAIVLVCAPSARAIPSAARSHVPGHVLLVGKLGALADTTTGAFTVVVHDVADAPVENSVVEVRILNCPGARLASDAYLPGATIHCDTHGVLGATNTLGEVRLTVVGAGIASGPAGSGACVQFYASGVPLGFASLAYVDMDGSGGVGANDLALWLADFNSGEDIIGRSDYDGSGHLTANDLSIWLGIWGAGESFQSPAAYCP